jgi:hypothetical protein
MIENEKKFQPVQLEFWDDMDLPQRRREYDLGTMVVDGAIVHKGG